MEQVFGLLCFANSQSLVVCMHVCEHTESHHFNVKIALNISGLGALHTGRDANPLRPGHFFNRNGL